MRLTPQTQAPSPPYPARQPRRRKGERLRQWCGKTVATGAALLALSLSACSATDEVRLAGGWAPSAAEGMELSFPPAADGKPPQRAPVIVRDPRKPPPPGGPGHRRLPPPRRTRT